MIKLYLRSMGQALVNDATCTTVCMMGASPCGSSLENEDLWYRQARCNKKEQTSPNVSRRAIPASDRCTDTLQSYTL